jgi:CheY-like chemotaxis protein
MQPYFTDVLLIDDDPITNFLNESLLQELQVAQHIAVALNGKDALEFIQTHWRDQTHSTAEKHRKLILLDINMPVMDGFEFLEHYEKIARHDEVCVAMLSSSDNPKDLVRARFYPITACMEKPLDEEKIKRLLEL